MYQNIPQQNPYYQYGNNYMPQYQRAIPMDQNAQMSQYGMPNPQPSQGFLKGRPVVSIEEARASQIDLDGSLFVFTDIGNKKIYTKQINLDGTASLNTFALVEEDKNTPPPEYVTKAEFDRIVSQLGNTISVLQKELNERAVSSHKTQTESTRSNVNTKF